MTSRNRWLTGFLALVSAGVLALTGYLIGASHAPTAQDAAHASRVASSNARARSFRTTERRAYKAGVKQGQFRGLVSGSRKGTDDGTVQRVQREAFYLALQEAQAKEKRLAEEVQRARNCGAALFATGACPTDAEVAQESQAESLCGGGTPEGLARASELGIEC